MSLAQKKLILLAICLVSVPFFFTGRALAYESASSAVLNAQFIIPNTTDSNGDGVPDSWYETYGLDPDDVDVGRQDPDKDGITNLEEYRLDTDPTVSNSGITATLTPSSTGGLQPLDITFTAGASGNILPIVRYEWDFDGNGTYDKWSYASEGNAMTHKFTAAGTYNVKLRVTDAMGQAGIATSTVNIGRNSGLAPPTAATNLNFADISVPTTLQLKASASDDKGVARYQWDTTGNGEFDLSSDDSGDLTKTYNETTSRSFNAAFKVTDTDGLSAISTVGVNINAAAWRNSPSKPKVYLDNTMIQGTAGVPISLGGYGTPQLGYAKKLEWDFEGDGICDWASSIENSDWTGRADTTHTYGAPGIYRAVLKVHTEANVSATDSVLVVIAQNSGTPPAAQAKVSYNGTTAAAEINGAIPVKAVFDHSFSTGQITKYEWDFDGDKRIDYSTTSALVKPNYDYKYPGYYTAMLRVTDVNGLIDTYYIPVFAYYPATYSSYVKMPLEGQTIAGNAVTLDAEVFPDDAGVNTVMFQYRKSGDAAWVDIGPGKPVLSYMVTWDTTTLDNGATYELRAIVNGADSTAFKLSSVVVDNTASSPDVYENTNGTHTKKMKVDKNRSSTVILPDGTNIDIPIGAVPDGITDPVVTITEESGFSAGVGNSINIKIAGLENFIKDIVISIPYDDANNDGIVDGVGLNENQLAVKWHNPTTNLWEPLYDSVVYPMDNFVSARINHLSLFGLGLFAGGGSGMAVIGGGARTTDFPIISYCFIATAAYGTPMDKEVVILREFRDVHLMHNKWGRKFVWYYYRYSPPVAKFIEDKPKLRAVVRFMLKPLLKLAKNTVRRR